MVRFFILFIVILVSLFTVELTHPVQNAIVLPWTGMLARISAAILVFFDGAVISYGKVLQNSVTGASRCGDAGGMAPWSVRRRTDRTWRRGENGLAWPAHTSENCHAQTIRESQHDGDE